jgi:hypothetical protein
MVARWWTLTPTCGPISFWIADIDGSGGDVIAAADDELCRIYFDRAFWLHASDPTDESVTSDPFTLCVTIAHEYGHLLGYQHVVRAVSEPQSIMTADGDAQPLPCVQRWPLLAYGGAILAHPR